MATATKDVSALAPRQREALGYFEQGLSTRETAERMGVGTSAAADHRRRLIEKGFMRKARRRGQQGQRRQAPTGVRGSARGSGAAVGGNGKVLLDSIPSLPKTLEEIDGKIEANTEEMRALNARQSALADESSGLARLREEIDGTIKSLA